MALDTSKLDSLRIDRRRRRRGGWLWFVLLLLFLGGAGAGGYWWWINRPQIVPVRTVTVVAKGSKADRTLLNASGYVTARRDATVSSKVTGKVVEVMVEEGMHVDEGQVLARLDASNVTTSLDLANAQLDASRSALGETEANLAQAKRELERLEEANASGAATRLEMQRAETLVQSLEARIDRQQAEIAVGEREVRIWQQQLDDTIIRAPFAGVVTAKNAQPGEMISPMSVGGFTRTGICTIVDMSSLEIEVDVSESYINRVQAGMPVEATLDSYADWKIPAKVIAIIPTADRQKATVKVRVGFEELDPRILPDMGVKVAFQKVGEEPTQLAGIDVTQKAIATDNGRDVVWLVREGKAERRAVTLGERKGDSVLVLAGLAGGERVVIDPPATLKDGIAVKEERQ
jgi:HlyD family secretion protein